MGLFLARAERAFGSALLLALLVAGAPQARATACSTAALVQDITAANNASGGTLTLAAGCDYAFIDGSANGGVTALPAINKPLTIEGNGATIRRDTASTSRFRLFVINSGTSVVLRNLTISGGLANAGGDGSNATAVHTATSGSPGAHGGGIQNYGTLVLDHVTLAANQAGMGGNGGACFSDQLVSFVSRTGGTGGQAGNGGAIWNAGSVTIMDSVLRQNEAGQGGAGGGCSTGTAATGGNGGSAGQGGGVWNESGATLLIQRSTVFANKSGVPGAAMSGVPNGGNATQTGPSTGAWGRNSNGGGIGGAGTIVIEDSTIERNVGSRLTNTYFLFAPPTIDGGFGGGIWAVGGSLIVRRSTLVGNLLDGANPGYAAPGGGGLYVNGTALLENVTVASNHASATFCTPGGDGGGIFVDAGGDLTLRNTTVSDNSWSTPGCAGDYYVPGIGASIYNGGGTVRLANSILSTNITALAEKAQNFNCGGVGTYLDLTVNHNIAWRLAWLQVDEQDFCPSSVRNVDPKLGVLDASTGNGRDPALGPAVLALNGGSAAVNAGDNATCLPTDERGVARPQGSSCDVGAYETRLTLLTSPVDATVIVPAPATFQASVDSDGNGAPSAQWQSSPDGITWSDIGGANNLVVQGSSYTSTYVRNTTAMADQALRFRVIFRNDVMPAGVTSNAAKLTVDFGPTITTDLPASLTANVGSTFNLHFGYTAYPDVAVVQWEVSTDGGGNWSNLFAPADGGTGGTITIPQLATAAMYTATTGGHSYKYRVRLSNAYPGGPSATSAVTTVTVTDLPAAPKITNQFYLATDQFFEGEIWAATVNVSGNPLPTVGWQSSSDGGLTWNDLANGSEYHFNSDTTATSGLSQLQFIAYAYHDGRMFRPVAGGNVFGVPYTMFVRVATVTSVDCPHGALVGTTYACTFKVTPTPLIGPLDRVPQGRLLASGAVLDPPDSVACPGQPSDHGCCILDATGSCTIMFDSAPPVGNVSTIKGEYSLDLPLDTSISDRPSSGTTDVLATNCSMPAIAQCAPTRTIASGDTCGVTVPDFLSATSVTSAGCEASLVLTQSIGAGTLLVPGDYPLTITATNDAGSTTCSTNLTISEATTIDLIGKNPTLVECGGAPYQELGATVTQGACGTTPAAISGSVDVSLPDFYTITYSTYDASHNLVTATRSVIVEDTLPPALTLNGPPVLQLECGAPFYDPGALAKDQCVGDYPLFGLGTLDMHTPGDYTWTYQATDGGDASITRDLAVRDTLAPVLQCPGPISVFAEQGTLGPAIPFVVAATDQCNGSVPVQTPVPSGARFPIGVTPIKALGTDTSGNTGSCGFSITVQPTPTHLTIDSAVASTPSSIGNTYSVPVQVVELNTVIATGTIVVSDGTDQCMITLPEAACSLPSTAAGTKTITATYSGDTIHSGSSADTTHDVLPAPPCAAPTIDTCAPAQAALVAACAAPMPDFTATTKLTAVNGCNATLSQSVAAGNQVAVGVTPVTITATNSAGSATCASTFTLSSSQAPTITLNGGAEVTVECGASYQESGATAVAACGGANLPVTRSGTVDSTKAGDYSIIYNADAGGGNIATATRIVHVRDTQAPLITLDGSNPTMLECRAAYVDAGAVARDACGNTSLPATATGAVNTSMPASYAVTYNASDAAGNVSMPVARNVIVADTIAPTIACPTDITVPAAPGTCAANVAFTVAGGDSCDAHPQLALSKLSGSTFGVGTTTVAATNTDASGNTNACSFNVTVTSASTRTVLGLAYETQQYSDPQTLSAAVTNMQDNTPVGSGSVTFKIGGSTVGTVAVNANGVATLALNLVESALLAKADVAPGTHTVTATFNGGGCLGASADSKNLSITAEDARVTYTGLNWVPACSASSATVTLSASVKDISAVDPLLSPPTPDNSPGVISNATLAFVNRDTNKVLCSAPVGLISAADKQSGTAACNAALPIGDYQIGLVVDGYYSRNDADADNQVLEVATSCGTGSISGGGYLALVQPAGDHAGDIGSHTNFGFNVKYNKPKTSLQGSVNTIIRKAGRLYQVKGNAMTSLVTDTKITAAHPYPTATFFGKANLTDITDPLNPVTLPNGGGALLRITMTDKRDPGKPVAGVVDTIGITVWYSDSAGAGLFYSTNWNGSTTLEQALGIDGGGNVDIR